MSPTVPRGRVSVGSGVGAVHYRQLELVTRKVTFGDGGLRVNGRCICVAPGVASVLPGRRFAEVPLGWRSLISDFVA